MLDNLTKHEGGEEVYEVPFKGSDFSTIVSPLLCLYGSRTTGLGELQCGHAEDPETRKRAMQSSAFRLQRNVPVLDRIFDLRRQIAAIMGYPSWADFVLEERMAKNPKNVVEVSESIFLSYS